MIQSFGNRPTDYFEYLKFSRGALKLRAEIKPSIPDSGNADVGKEGCGFSGSPFTATYNLKNMKTIFIIMLSALISGSLQAQMIMSGIVWDGTNNQPLEGATVWQEPAKSGTFTDINGSFSLTLPEGSAGMVRFSYVGYRSVSIRAEAKQGITILLFPESELREVVITSGRAADADPVTQKTIAKKEIEENYIGQDGAFLLERLSPSIVSWSDAGTGIGNYGQMRLRGIDQTRINITLNGAPLNDMIDQGVFFSNFIDFGNSIESVQVQRGIGTSTNGTSSYAGSISFESPGLNDSLPSAEVQILGGSFATRRASAELYTGKISKGFSAYSRITSFQSDGYKLHSSTDSWSMFFSGMYSGSKDKIRITGFTGRSKNGLAYLPVAEQDIIADPRTNYVNENDIDNFGQSFLQLQHSHIFQSASLISSLYMGGAGGDFPAGFYVTDSIFSSTSPGSYYISDRLVQVNYPLFNRHYGLTSNLVYSNLPNTLDLQGGIHLYTFRRNNLESILPDNENPYYDERSVKNEFSAFAKTGIHPGKLTLYADVQFRAVSLTISPDKTLLPAEPDIGKNWVFLNPKAGLTYAFDNTKNLYVFAGRSYREPTKIDILGGFELYPSNLPSAKSDDVKPEQVDDIEGGFRMHDKRISLGINFFNMNFRNEIAPIGELDATGFIQLRKNIDRSYRRGIELDYRLQLPVSFELSGNLTWMQSRIVEYAPSGDPMVYINVEQALSPPIISAMELCRRFGDLASVSVTGRYIGESFLEPTNQPDLTIPSSFIMSARAEVTFLKRHSLEIMVENLFDELYYTNGTPVDTDYNGIPERGYFVQPPRSIYLGLVFRL